MAAFLVIVTIFMLFPTEGMQEFSRHSNGIAEYRFVRMKVCESGLRGSGYDHTPTNLLVFKQVNEDGTVTQPTCE